MLCAALAGCGGDEDEAAAPVPQPAGGNALSVVVTGAASQPIRMALRCGGDVRPARPCASAIAPRDPAAACTQQYGGPERAQVSGTFDGKPVDVVITREDGCGIADYEALFAAFGRQPPVAG